MYTVVHTYTCRYIYRYIDMQKCVYVYTHKSMCMCVHKHIHTCMCIHMSAIHVGA